MENDNLKKIDDILKRTNTDYATAKQALDNANGDVLDAVIALENKRKNSTISSYTSKTGNQLIDQMKNIISKGNTTKLTIKRNGDTIINLPITAGIVGAFIAPFLSAAGITAALLTQCTVEITQSDGQVIDLGQKMEDGMDAVKNVMQDVKEDAVNIKDKVVEEAQDMKYAFSQSTQNMKTTASQTAQDIKSAASQTAQELIKTASQSAQNLKSTVSQSANDIKETTGNVNDYKHY